MSVKWKITIENVFNIVYFGITSYITIQLQGEANIDLFTPWFMKYSHSYYRKSYYCMSYYFKVYGLLLEYWLSNNSFVDFWLT